MFFFLHTQPGMQSQLQVICLACDANADVLPWHQA